MPNVTELKVVRNALNNIIEGKNPVLDTEIEEKYKLKEPSQFIAISHIIKLLTASIESESGNKKHEVDFFITKSEQAHVVLPDENITITQFVNAINDVMSFYGRLKLTAKKVNDQLVKMGLLERIKESDNKYRAHVTHEGLKRGIYENYSKKNNKTYLRVAYNDQGKLFLLNNINDIMSFEPKDSSS